MSYKLNFPHQLPPNFYVLLSGYNSNNNKISKELSILAAFNSSPTIHSSTHFNQVFTLITLVKVSMAYILLNPMADISILILYNLSVEFNS